jgi:hypothetical protein
MERLSNAISSTIADLERYRKQRIAHHKENEPKPKEIYQGGLVPAPA